MANCKDKLAFETKAQAEGAKIYAMHLHGAELKVYKCRECSDWHLSSV
jgi:hypothetical protein